MNIFITYAYAGVGHKKAAEAVHKAVAGLDAVDATIVDVLDYTNGLCKFLYPRIYLFLIDRLPLLWGFAYYLLDIRLVDRLIAPVRRFLHNLQAKRFVNFVLDENPDVVICTHFFPAEVISELKKKDIFKGRLITVITDLLPHSFWMATNSDYFVTAIERTKKDLVGRGVKEECIKVLGIPTDPKFSILQGRKELVKRLGLEQGLFNLLIMSGGFGTGPVREIVDSICTLGSEMVDRIQIIVICGKNKKLFAELNRLKLGLKVKLGVFGYMDNIDEFMEASDCIITKSGGLTISESLSKRLPMIIIRPIPGQETRNCKVLTGYGVAVRANSVGEARDYVEDFILFPERIIGMKTRIGLLSYPNAAKDLANFVTQAESLTM